MTVSQINSNNISTKVLNEQVKTSTGTSSQEENLFDLYLSQDALESFINIDGDEKSIAEIQELIANDETEAKTLTETVSEFYKKVKSAIESAIAEQQEVAKDYAAFVESTITDANSRISSATTEEERDNIASNMQDKVQERSGTIGPRAMEFISVLVDQIYNIAGIERGIDRLNELKNSDLVKNAGQIVETGLSHMPETEALKEGSVEKLDKKLDVAWENFYTMIDTVVDSNDEAVDTIEDISGKPFQEKEKSGSKFNQSA